jgi:hypothetical protein
VCVCTDIHLMYQQMCWWCPTLLRRHECQEEEKEGAAEERGSAVRKVTRWRAARGGGCHALGGRECKCVCVGPGVAVRTAGAQFTCFTSIKVQILTR